MVIDFSKIDLKERPILVLRNVDGTAIQTLGYAFNLKGDICYRELSSITFDIPAYVEGKKTPHYDEIVGTRTVELVGWGQFILENPERKKSGKKEIKSCKAYSLEYELANKNIYLEENTYNFWNPVSPDDTVLGIILSYLPSWSIGEIDESLIGKYRTFDEKGSKIYNFIKSKAEQTYGCIFDFDTYKREINVRAISSFVSTLPIYISPENLSKAIEVTEDSKSIVTVLDVNGAEGVDIRGINPMGTNKIYNLDYYISSGQISEDMAAQWSAWKDTFESRQLVYYNITIEKMLKTAAIVTETDKLATMKDSELATLQNKQAVIIEFLASISDKSSESYTKYQTELSAVNAEIALKEAEIIKQENYIQTLTAEKENLTKQQVAINKETSFASFFTAEELVILDRYFKEDGIQDSSFVVTDVQAYINEDMSSDISNVSFSFEGCVVTKTEGYSEKEVYMLEGGRLNAGILDTNIVRASLERKSDGQFILSAHLGSGSINSIEHLSGNISLTGSCGVITNTASSLSFIISNAHFYYTKNSTEYERFSVEWDLFKYGNECLGRLCYPSNSFSITTANFLAHDDFVAFAGKLRLGSKVYLELDENLVIEPILIKVSVDFENLASLKLEFGDTYSLADSAFSLVDLLEKSVTMGKTVDTSRFSYNSFIDSGASTAVKEFMGSALDVSKNAILSSDGMAISWGTGGIRCRKWNESKIGYEPEQIAIINNNIVFTDDAWQSAKMALGHFTDTNLGDVWGLVAPSVVGTLLAGNNLVIESVKKDGGISVFKVDADGAVLHNARFDIENGVSHIVLDPTLGFAIGNYPVLTQKNGLDIWDEDKAKFWVDTEGNLHFKGTLEGANGKFSGELSAATGTFAGELQAATGSFSGELKAATGSFSGELKAATGSFCGDISAATGTFSGGLNIGNGNFIVDSNGNLTAKSGTFYGTVRGAKFLDSNGNEMMTDGKWDSEYLDLGNIQIDGATGNISMTGSIDMGGDINMDGSITLKGDITLGGNITWSSDSSPVKVLYSPVEVGRPVGAYSTFPDSSTAGWHKVLDNVNDYYVSYSYDGGKTWTDIMKLQGKDGEDGEDGAPGSSASVTYSSIKSALNRASLAGLKFTEVGSGSIDTPELYTARIFASDIYAGEDTESTFSRMTDEGFVLYWYGDDDPKILLGGGELDNNYYPYLILGSGSGTDDSRGLVKKFDDGLWIGNSACLNTSTYDVTGANGIFINFKGDIVFKGNTSSIATFA